MTERLKYRPLWGDLAKTVLKGVMWQPKKTNHIERGDAWNSHLDFTLTNHALDITRMNDTTTSCNIPLLEISTCINYAEDFRVRG